MKRPKKPGRKNSSRRSNEVSSSAGGFRRDLIPPGHRLVMGLHSVQEVLNVRPEAVKSVWLRGDYFSHQSLQEVAQWAESQRVRIEFKSTDFLNRWTSGHQGVGLLVSESPSFEWRDLEPSGARTVLILDGVEDPHNLGALIRTAWLMGVSAIFAPENRAAGLSPTACKVASGGAEHVPVVFETALPQVVERLKELDFWVYGLAAEAKSSLWDLKLEGKVAWILGSEEKGIRKPLARSCDELVRIPQISSSASYNVSVAGAMALCETFRQFQAR